MMGGGRLPFPSTPPGTPGVMDLARERELKEEREDEERERREREEDEEDERRLAEDKRQKSLQERTIDCKEFEDSSVRPVNNNENRMVVSLQLNSVTYQGV